ncbi:hypothetical protein FRC04_009404 [Tulasnella sp. 424]|nr:hypothetical protein FRC04_009404 [Tulasnella sp. 424]KAG8971851.1 hypothetical protein FRC05_010518 [Tulasnella sp. 425]
MSALHTPLRASKRLPTQLGRTWASRDAPKTASTATPKSEAKVDSKGLVVDSQGERNHLRWKSVRGVGKKNQWKARSPAEDEYEPPVVSFDKVPSIVLQKPAPTSVHKLKRMLDPSAPFFKGALPLRPPTLSMDPAVLSRAKSVEFLRSSQMTKHLKTDPNAQRLENLSPSQVARHVLTRNQAMSNANIKESLRTVRTLSENKSPVASA